jgi:hypothetical protein
MSETVEISPIVVASLALSLLGLVAVRRTVPSQRLAEHTDVAGYVYAVLGVIYAVILAFVVIAAWEEYREAERATADEAAAVLNLARMTDAWPGEDRANMGTALVAYARQVVDVEWPAMAEGDLAPATDTLTVNRIWHALNEANEAAANRSASYEAAIAQLDLLGTARGQRVLLAQEGLPESMTFILIVGGIVTIAFSYLFVIDDGPLHALMTASLTLLVALLLLLQHQLSAPFQGNTAIEPTGMELVLAEIDSGAGLPGMQQPSATPTAGP